MNILDKNESASMPTSTTNYSDTDVGSVEGVLNQTSLDSLKVLKRASAILEFPLKSGQ